MFAAIARFRQDLKSGNKCLGVGITLTDPLVSEALGDSVDFLWVDLEHSSMSPEILYGHLLAARSKGVPSIVRVTAGITPLIKTALDGGADGIIVPQVRSAEEVRRVVADCRYPPLGSRGFGPRVPSNYGRVAGPEYIEAANENIFVAVMIETAEAYEAIDEIVAIPGLDSVVLGPADLTLALGEGRNTGSPMVQQAIETIIAAATRAGKFVGSGLGPDVNFALHLATLGVQWLQVGQDYDYLIQYADGIRSGFHRRWGPFQGVGQA